MINDGSDDRTAEILAERTDPDLYVVEREGPAGEAGQAAALNYALTR